MLANQFLKHICDSHMDTVLVSTLKFSLELLLLSLMYECCLWLVGGDEDMFVEPSLESRKIKVFLKE